MLLVHAEFYKNENSKRSEFKILSKKETYLADKATLRSDDFAQ